MLDNLSKSHINPYLTHWSPFKGFQSRLMQPWLQNIYGSNLPNGLYTILYIMDTTLYPYSIVHLRWPKSMDNVSLWHIIPAWINIALAIVTTILMVHSADPFWCEAPSPLKLIFCYFFNISLLNIPLSVWYTFIITPWLWSSLFNKTLYRVWRPSILLKSKKIIN